jgi:cardiolipin synthase C
LIGALQSLLAFVAIVVAAIVAARLIFALPSVPGRPSHAIPADPATPLGAAMSAAAAEHPGLSGIVPLRDGLDALASRLALVEAAQRSIDAQYYMWHDDVSGRLLLKKILEAAQRGVRVRLLLDDNGVDGLDPTIAALNAQGNFEVRLFNPSTVRRPKLMGYAFDFFRMNRRMHNKALIVDGAAAIIGGRNIGDEYFRVGDAGFFIDLDVLGLGPVVPHTAAAFDLYWNCASVFPVEQLIAGQGDFKGFLANVTEAEAAFQATGLAPELAAATENYRQNAMAPEWTNVRLVVDDPIKGLGRARRDQLMFSRLLSLVEGVERKLDLVSAYFVPGKGGARLFADLARSGKPVRILTNALNTTDVAVVHAGYTKYRRRLLKAGVKLYELKLRADQETGRKELAPFGLSGGSLHTKTFAIDGERVFVGSFNFDPRSAQLNSEMGFLIDSPTLAKEVEEVFDGPVPLVSYQPLIGATGRLRWIERKGEGGIVTYKDEPQATWFQRATVFVAGWLPVEWLL